MEAYTDKKLLQWPIQYTNTKTSAFDFMTKFMTKIANWWRQGYESRLRWLYFIISILLVYIPINVYNYYHTAAFKARAKMGTGTILGVDLNEGKYHDNYIRVRYAYNNKYFEERTGGSVTNEKVIRNISKFRRKKVLIAIDSLYPECFRLILTDEQYKEYGLVQPDSLKWFNYVD